MSILRPRSALYLFCLAAALAASGVSAGNYREPVPATAGLASAQELIVNGGFETGNFTGWTKASTANGDFVINSGALDPAGPGVPLPPLAGAYDVVSQQTGPSTQTIYQDVIVPAVGAAVLRWSDHITNYGPSFLDPTQEFRAEIRDTADVVLTTVFSTNPGDALLNDWVSRTADLSQFAGRTVRIVFTQQVTSGYFNVHLDNISLQVGLAQPDELILNGGFENGDFTNWVKSSVQNGDFVINNGSLDPQGPEGPLAPFAGTYCAMSQQSGGGTHTIYQQVSIPSGAPATLRWTDRIRNHGTAFVDPTQEFRVEIRDTADVVLATVFSTNPGDPFLREWAPRSVDVSQYAGRTVRIAFTEQDNIGYFNVYLDNVSLMSEGSGQSPILVENLDTGPGWTRSGPWAYGQPMGLGGRVGFPDPKSGYTGSKVYGINLGGNYSTSIEGPYYLQTKTIDCSKYAGVRLSFRRWLNVDWGSYVAATVQVSSDSTNWTSVYANPISTPVTDSEWQLVEYDIGSVADGKPAVSIRWGHQVLKQGAIAYAGWNIDDIAVSGNRVAPYSISGAVTKGGVGLPGVTLTAVPSGKTAKTEASGHFTIDGLTTGNYTVVPTLSGYVFTPASRQVAVGPDATGIDFTAVESPVLRVKWDSAFDGPGNDWEHAFHTVTAAFAASQTNYEIWVAGDSAHPYPGTTLLKAGVGLYGGFAGTETRRDQRKWWDNVTILQGTTGGNVVAVPPGATTATVLDGFTVRGGSNGVYCSSSPTISNNTIADNSSAGILCSGTTTAPSSPVIASNIITGRLLLSSQRGIVCSYNSSPSITNNTIIGLRYGIDGLDSSPTISNNIVAFGKYGVNLVLRSAGTPVLRNNCIYNPAGTNYTGVLAGAGDISVDPLFVSRSTGDLHLQVSSPCVDKGLNSSVPAASVDMDGEPRILPADGVVDIGADEFTYTVGEARAYAPDGHRVFLSRRSPVVATAKFPDQQAFYVERPDRSSGLRCSGTALLDPGQTGALQGIMGTMDGERVLLDASVVEGTLATSAVPNPLRLTCRSVGGAAMGLQAGTLGGRGINTVGLLVTVSGRVTLVDPGGQYFTISDGSVWPGAPPPADPDGHKGIGIAALGMLPSGLKEGDFAAVTGIGSCHISGSDLYPQILVRTPEDVEVASQ